MNKESILSTDRHISALFMFFLFTSIMLPATEQIVNHLTKIFYEAIPGRSRAVHRPARFTYFTRLFMLNYMLIIPIEQQLEIGLIYLIYNSEMVTRRQTQHDPKVDQDVHRLYSACYPKSFRLNFQTDIQYDPA